MIVLLFFFSSRRRHTRSKRDWSSDVCSSDLELLTKLDIIAIAIITINKLLNTKSIIISIILIPLYLNTFSQSYYHLNLMSLKRHQSYHAYLNKLGYSSNSYNT